MNEAFKGLRRFKIVQDLLKGKINVLLDKEGQLYFIAADVCDALGYKPSSTPNTVKSHVDVEDVKHLVVETPGGPQEKLAVNEQGFYCLIFGATSAKGKEFRRWCTKEVLPAIREDGGYINGQEDLPPEQREALREQVRSLAGEVERLLYQVGADRAFESFSFVRRRALIDWLSENGVFEWLESQGVDVSDVLKGYRKISDNVFEYYENGQRVLYNAKASTPADTMDNCRPKKKNTSAEDGNGSSNE